MFFHSGTVQVRVSAAHQGVQTAEGPFSCPNQRPRAAGVIHQIYPSDFFSVQFVEPLGQQGGKQLRNFWDRRVPDPPSGDLEESRGRPTGITG